MSRTLACANCVYKKDCSFTTRRIGKQEDDPSVEEQRERCREGNRRWDKVDRNEGR